MKSLSDKRLLVLGTINGKPAIMLIDTGATVGLLDIDCKNKYNISVYKKYPGTLIGAGGGIDTGYISTAVFTLLNKTANQFVYANISSVQESIYQLTGYKITGILGLPQMKFMGIVIDTNANTIDFK